MADKKYASIPFASSLSNICEANNSFDTGILRVCYTGQNRNGSAISKNDIERNLHTIFNCPVVCNYDRDTDTLGGHDMEVVSGEDGTMRLVNLTQPVGVIPESAKTWFDNYTEEDGSVHEYLYTEVLLWKRQEAYQKIKNDGVTAHSMELSIQNGETIDGVYHIHDFEFTAFALIGVEPCFEGSALEMFSMNEFKERYAQMMEEMKEMYKTVDAANAAEDIETFAKGGNEAMEQEVEMTVVEESVEECAHDTVDCGVLSAEFSAEGNAVASAEDVEDHDDEKAQSAESLAEESTNVAEEETFALNSNIEQELRRALHSETYIDRWGDECRKYHFVDFDVDESMVYFEAVQEWKLYGCRYDVAGDVVHIDFDNAKRMKWVIAEFNDDADNQPVVDIFKLLEEKIDKKAEFEAKYTEASAQIESIQGELEELREFKSSAEADADRCARDEVFAMFSDLNGVEAFEALKVDNAEYDVSTLEEKCFAIRGRLGSPAKFAMQDSAPKIRVERVESVAEEPYGELFIKYKAH